MAEPQTTSITASRQTIESGEFVRLLINHQAVDADAFWECDLVVNREYPDGTGNTLYRNTVFSGPTVVTHEAPVQLIDPGSAQLCAFMTSCSLTNIPTTAPVTGPYRAADYQPATHSDQGARPGGCSTCGSSTARAPIRAHQTDVCTSIQVQEASGDAPAGTGNRRALYATTIGLGALAFYASGRHA